MAWIRFTSEDTGRSEAINQDRIESLYIKREQYDDDEPVLFYLIYALPVEGNEMCLYSSPDEMGTQRIFDELMRQIGEGVGVIQLPKSE